MTAAVVVVVAAAGDAVGDAFVGAFPDAVVVVGAFVDASGLADDVFGVVVVVVVVGIDVGMFVFAFAGIWTLLLDDAFSFWSFCILVVVFGRTAAGACCFAAASGVVLILVTVFSLLSAGAAVGDSASTAAVAGAAVGGSASTVASAGAAVGGSASTVAQTGAAAGSALLAVVFVLLTGAAFWPALPVSSAVDLACLAVLE